MDTKQLNDWLWGMAKTVTEVYAAGIRQGQEVPGDGLEEGRGPSYSEQEKRTVAEEQKRWHQNYGKRHI